MIAACPKCEARYRVDESRIGAEGARMRCAKCQAVFKVRAPAQAPAAPAPAAAPPQPVPQPPTAPAPSAPQTDPEVAPTAQPRPQMPAAEVPPGVGVGGVVDRDRLVLVADPNVESGKRTADALSSWGLQPILVHDGVEAMLTTQRMLPRIVILDAALPKMYGFQVCEVIKRNGALRETGVVLVGAIHNRERYHRPPVELYGADFYLEHPDLPDGLIAILKQFGLELGEKMEEAAPPARSSAPLRPPASTPPAPTPAAPPAAAPPEPAQVTNQPMAGGPELVSPPAPAIETPAAPAAGNEQVEKAERLARIIVSDIVLYQPEKFAEGVARGRIVEAMDAEIEEGRALFRQRIDEVTREQRDFIVEELIRVARERGMQ